ncbi:tail fiber assembly protein [Escherichia coli]|nr:tail fiber assembly protein [Escherichia coli]
MSNFALVRNGVVENVVLWDGEGDIFSDYEVINVDDISAGVGWLYNNGAFIAPPAPEIPHEEHVYQAESRKSSLLNEAYSTISIWQTELLLGTITEESRMLLIEWLEYIKALKDVDTSTAPNIIWPESPEN